TAAASLRDRFRPKTECGRGGRRQRQEYELATVDIVREPDLVRDRFGLGLGLVQQVQLIIHVHDSRAPEEGLRGGRRNAQNYDSGGTSATQGPLVFPRSEATRDLLSNGLKKQIPRFARDDRRLSYSDLRYSTRSRFCSGVSPSLKWES